MDSVFIGNVSFSWDIIHIFIYRILVICNQLPLHLLPNKCTCSTLNPD